MAESVVTERPSQRFVKHGDGRPIAEAGGATRYLRLQNTLVAWTEVSAAQSALRQDCEHEVIAVLPDAGAVLSAGSARVEAPARSLCILPPGPTVIEPQAPGRVVRFFSPVPDALGKLAINAADYAAPRAGVIPIGAPFARVAASGIRVFEIDRLKPERPGGAQFFRPPTIQSETMNVLWIEQDGPTDRGRLHPHSHEDFEEGALVVAGEYVQHLRTPWLADAREWREDEHVTCGPGTLTIVPPRVVHASEARGTGRHIMLNVFAPARDDHIKSGMVLNGGDYRPA